MFVIKADDPPGVLVRASRERDGMSIVEPKNASPIGTMQGQRIADAMGNLARTRHPVDVKLRPVKLIENYSVAIEVKQSLEAPSLVRAWQLYHPMIWSQAVAIQRSPTAFGPHDTVNTARFL